MDSSENWEVRRADSNDQSRIGRTNPCNAFWQATRRNSRRPNAINVRKSRIFTSGSHCVDCTDSALVPQCRPPGIDCDRQSADSTIMYRMNQSEWFTANRSLQCLSRMPISLMQLAKFFFCFKLVLPAKESVPVRGGRSKRPLSGKSAHSLFRHFPAF